LQLETRPDAWADWLAHHGVDDPAPQGMLFDQFAPMIQAAIYGLGVALLPAFLARSELDSGRLTTAWGGPVPARGSYWLVWPGAGACAGTAGAAGLASRHQRQW
jgi:LysR family transcriptional regulator, glycine cleavage system transcriptional activator